MMVGMVEGARRQSAASCRRRALAAAIAKGDTAPHPQVDAIMPEYAHRTPYCVTFQRQGLCWL